MSYKTLQNFTGRVPRPWARMFPKIPLWYWRNALGVEGPAGTPGSQRLIQAAAELGGEAMQDHTFTEAEREAKRLNARRLHLGRYLQTGYHGPRWKAEDLALLGTMPDAELARRAGKSETAVRVMRNRRGIERAK